jgi:hypothetical protein
MSKFPKVLYVKKEKDGDNSYFIADAALSDVVEIGESRDVAMYKLTEIGKAEGVVSVVKGRWSRSRT